MEFLCKLVFAHSSAETSWAFSCTHGEIKGYFNSGTCEENVSIPGKATGDITMVRGHDFTASLTLCTHQQKLGNYFILQGYIRLGLGLTLGFRFMNQGRRSRGEIHTLFLRKRCTFMDGAQLWSHYIDARWSTYPKSIWCRWPVVQNPNPGLFSSKCSIWSKNLMCGICDSMKTKWKNLKDLRLNPKPNLFGKTRR